MAHQWRKPSAPMMTVRLRINHWRNVCAMMLSPTAHQWRNTAFRDHAR
jgi:hypothetical protein